MSGYPCEMGDTVYVIDNTCNEGCEYENELCQQRICNYFKQFVVPVVVASMETKNYGGEDVIVFRDKEGRRKYQLGETTFLTKEEAESHMFRKVSFLEERKQAEKA